MKTKCVLSAKDLQTFEHMINEYFYSAGGYKIVEGRLYHPTIPTKTLDKYIIKVTRNRYQLRQKAIS